MKPTLHAWNNWANTVTLARTNRNDHTSTVQVLEPDEARALGRALIAAAGRAELEAQGSATSRLADEIEAR